MIAIVADYRVKSRHGVSGKFCVSDAKSAIRWVRKNASKLGIDKNKIAAGGGSAGGFLAAATASLSKFDEKLEDKSVSSKPNALVLFNPGLVYATDENMNKEIFKNISDIDTKKNLELKLSRLEKKMGTNPLNISPYHNITSKIPPTIIFHGKDDKIVPFISSELFTKKMHKFSNQCILVDYEGAGHGFFNYGKKSNIFYNDTLDKMDKFLVSIGYIK